MMPIYIPSRGRSEKASTPRVLEAVSFPYTLVVEPREYEDYQENFPQAHFMVLPESQRGVSYVRQYILEQAYKAGHTWYWMIDDDITAFFYVQQGRCVRSDANVLCAAESILSKYDDMAQLSLTPQLWAWKMQRPLSWNTYCNQVVCNNAQKVFPVARYREGVQEDIDMSLQLVASGYRVARWEHYAFSMPGCGTNKGGLHEEYARHDDTDWSCNMVRLWGPEIVRLIVDKRNRVNVIVNWRYFSATSIRKRLEEGV